MFSSSSLDVHVVYFDQLTGAAHLFVCLSNFFFTFLTVLKVLYMSGLNMMAPILNTE